MIQPGSKEFMGQELAATRDLLNKALKEIAAYEKLFSELYKWKELLKANFWRRLKWLATGWDEEN